MNKKGENFKRLAENRTNKIINMLHLLGNLSNTSNYEYTDEQVRLMFDTLEKNWIFSDKNLKESLIEVKDI